jgi:hypothetical protein
MLVRYWYSHRAYSGRLVGNQEVIHRAGLWEAPNSISKALRKVNSLWSNPRFVIALHSPNALLETGLH